MRQLFTVVIAALIGAAVHGQQPTPESSDAALTRRVLDLTYPVVDLVIGTSDTGAAGSALAGRVEALALTETATEIRIELAADVLFDFDKADIRPEAAAALAKAAAILRERGRGSVRVEGHTDAKGSASYNQTLSLRRAEAVRRWLAEHGGLEGLSFTTRGFGATTPVAANVNPDGSDNPQGRQRNRRVEIIAGKS